MILTPSTCPKCGDQLCTPTRSFRWPNVYNQTCRNARCLHSVRTVVTVAEPERPRSQVLPIEAEAPPPARSAIAEFERAYKAGTTKKTITRARRLARAAGRRDSQLKRLGRDR